MSLKPFHGHFFQCRIRKDSSKQIRDADPSTFTLAKGDTFKNWVDEVFHYKSTPQYDPQSRENFPEDISFRLRDQGFAYDLPSRGTQGAAASKPEEGVVRLHLDVGAWIGTAPGAPRHAEAEATHGKWARRFRRATSATSGIIRRPHVLLCTFSSTLDAPAKGDDAGWTEAVKGGKGRGIQSVVALLAELAAAKMPVSLGKVVVSPLPPRGADVAHPGEGGGVDPAGDRGGRTSPVMDTMTQAQAGIEPFEVPDVKLWNEQVDGYTKALAAAGVHQSGLVPGGGHQGEDFKELPEDARPTRSTSWSTSTSSTRTSGTKPLQDPRA